MHFLVNIPEIEDVPENCETCPFSYMDLCGIDRCKLSGRKLCGVHGKKLNDCRIVFAFNKSVTIIPTARGDERDKDTLFYFFETAEDINESDYDDMDMWNGEGD